MGNSHGHRKTRNSPTNNRIPSSNYYAPPPYLYAAPPGPSSSQIGNQAASRMTSLPYGHVDSSLRSLAGQAEGFGRFAVGGLHGPVYHVTTLAGTHNFGFFSLLCFLVGSCTFFPFLSFSDGWKRTVLNMRVMKDDSRRCDPLARASFWWIRL